MIYLSDLVPGFGFERKLKEMKGKEVIIERLGKTALRLKKKYAIPEEYLEVDAKKLRILTSIHVVNKLQKELKKEGLVPGITEELATYDQFEIESALL